MLPVLADDVTVRLGRSEAAQGLALATFGAAALAGRLPGGWLVDHRGRRTGLLAGAAVGLVAGALYAVSPSYPLLLVARAGHGAADAIVYTAVAAWAIDITPPDRRTDVLGFLAAGVWGGMALGPLLGAVLGRLSLVGLLVVAVSMIGLVVAALLPTPTPGRPESAPSATGSSAGGWLNRLWASEAVRPGLAVGLVNVGYATMTGFVVVHLDDRGGHGPVVLGAFALTVLVSRVFVLPAVRHIPRAVLLAVALAAMAGGLLVLASGPGLPVAVPAAVAVGLGFSVPWPVLAGGVMDVIPEQRRGAALGTMLVCVDLFVATASLAAGMVAARAGTGRAFVLAAVAVAGAGLVARPTRRSRLRPGAAAAQPRRGRPACGRPAAEYPARRDPTRSP